MRTNRSTIFNMEIPLFFIISIICVSLCLGEHNELPEFLHVCKQSDPQLNQCVIKAIDSIRPKLVTGINELNIPSIEPLDIGDLVLMEKDRHGYLLKTKNIMVYGAGNFKINKLNEKDHGQKFDTEILLPKLRIEGQYDVNGQFLTMPIRGNGQFYGNFTNFIGYIKVQGDVTDIDGEQRYSIKKLNIRVKIGKGKLLMTNLFGGDKILGDVINSAINDNFELLAYELMPPIEKALSKKFRTIANMFLHKFTFSQLFPE